MKDCAYPAHLEIHKSHVLHWPFSPQCLSDRQGAPYPPYSSFHGLHSWSEHEQYLWQIEKYFLKCLENIKRLWPTWFDPYNLLGHIHPFPHIPHLPCIFSLPDILELYNHNILEKSQKCWSSKPNLIESHFISLSNVFWYGWVPKGLKVLLLVLGNQVLLIFFNL